MRLEILVGMIASGKSTYAAKRATEGAVIVNADAIVLAIHGGRYSLYNDKLKPLYKAVETNLIMTAMAMRRDVVIDRTNLNVRTRSRYIAFGKMLDYEILGIIFPMTTPTDHAARRYHKESRGIGFEQWCRAAIQHAATYVEPRLDEGFSWLSTFDFESQEITPCGS